MDIGDHGENKRQNHLYNTTTTKKVSKEENNVMSLWKNRTQCMNQFKS